MQAEQLKDLVVNALEDIKAQDISVVDVRDRTSVTDFMVLASGTSSRHVKSLADSVVIEAKEQGIKYEKGVFPWMASGRALAMGRSEGFTKVLFDENKRVIGGAIVGVSAGDIISELALAIEMGCDAEDIALTIHPHPTLSESVMLAAEVFEGTITDLYAPKKKK